MAKPNQLPKLQFDGITANHQQWLSQLTDMVNTLAGYNGTIQLSDHLDLGGKRVQNIGDPVSATDAISHAITEKLYSAPALRPKLESSGTQPLRTMRRLNDQNQREVSSSYMRDLMSTAPNANEVFPTITNSGGGVSVSIPSALFTFADGTQIRLNARTDLLSLPAQYAINTIVSSGTLVTITTVAPSGLTAHTVVTIDGVTPSTFNTVTQLTSATPPLTLTYQDHLGTLSGTGGFVQTAGVYYYAVNKRQLDLLLLGPFTADSAENRINASFDGIQIVAVVVLTASGGSVAQTGGGGSPIVGSPCAGAMF